LHHQSLELWEALAYVLSKLLKHIATLQIQCLEQRKL
jgi:hypothetical protein